jgi:hypothetical protein
MVDHPRYANRVIATWIGCHHSRVHYLRKWAANGFAGAPFGNENKPDPRTGAGGRNQPLETNENLAESASEPAAPPPAPAAPEPPMDPEVAEPDEVEDNVIASVRRSSWRVKARREAHHRRAPCTLLADRKIATSYNRSRRVA